MFIKVLSVKQKHSMKNLKIDVVASSSNGWLSKELVLKFFRQVLGMFSFKKHLLAWDTFKAHMTEDVRKLLKQMKTDDALIPGGCTK